MYKSYIKRVLDCIIASLILLGVLPLIIFIIIIVFFSTKHSPFYRQLRSGKDGKEFRVLKFRTMNNKIDSNGNLLPDKYRLTKIGRFLRSYSLDELPQLINVLKGKMSMVGPRPLLTKYIDLYNYEQIRRLEVFPGITGWAQINGRNAITWEERFKMDVWYVDNISFLLDMKILWVTVMKAFKREGINSANATTMRPFTGSNFKS